MEPLERRNSKVGTAEVELAQARREVGWGARCGRRIGGDQVTTRRLVVVAIRFHFGKRGTER